MAGGAAWSWLAALVAFAVVTSVTPGPNNALLWASGAQFGFRRTLRHVAGTSLGIGAMAVAVAGGLGALVAAVPAAALALKAAGSVYLLYLAVRIALSGTADRPEAARPLDLRHAAAFQALNPKGWIFVIAALGTFRPAGVPIAAGSALVIGTMMLVVLPTAAVWAAGGTVIGRLLTSARARRTLSLGLAALLAASVAYLWI
jgi:threonine/homoserine/homoserine lactone efflux protein